MNSEQVSPPSLEIAALPPSVARLRARILQTVAGGAIDDLLIPIQWNEVPPLFTRNQPQTFDAIAYLKARSFDGTGREILRILGAILGLPYAVRTRGPTITFEWPAFSFVPERLPTGSDRIAAWRCVRFADLRRTTSTGGPMIHRTAIGIDGTWHFFWPDA